MSLPADATLRCGGCGRDLQRSQALVVDPDHFHFLPYQGGAAVVCIDCCVGVPAYTSPEDPVPPEILTEKPHVEKFKRMARHSWEVQRRVSRDVVKARAQNYKDIMAELQDSCIYSNSSRIVCSCAQSDVLLLLYQCCHEYSFVILI